NTGEIARKDTSHLLTKRLISCSNVSCGPIIRAIKREVKRMANSQHVNLLKKGSTAWNIWREKHVEIQPNLSGARFIGARLIGANLKDAILRGTDLNGADLK